MVGMHEEVFPALPSLHPMDAAPQDWEGCSNLQKGNHPAQQSLPWQGDLVCWLDCIISIILLGFPLGIEALALIWNQQPPGEFADC